MKRCPQCNRVETDEALKFCRVDGTTLVSESSGLGVEAGSALGVDANEVHTSILPHRTDANIDRATARTTVLPSEETPATTGQLTTPKRRLSLRTGVLIAAAIGVTLLIGGYFFFTRNRTAAIDSIAVLPFQNVGGDPSFEYLSDGIAESLINSLTQIQQLRVIARNTAFRYKGKEVDAQQIGKDLNVRAVLSGRLRQVGDKLNIQVDLVDAVTGAQLWGEEYERPVTDALSIKQAIAREITEKLRIRLSGEQQQQMVRRETSNPEAYQFYLRGRYYWNRRSADGLKKAITEFQQAVERDPNYALGYVGLADCNLVLEEYAGTPSTETLPKAQSAAERALQIDPSLAEAHTSLAFLFNSQWRWAEAEEEFRKSIALNPNYPTTHHWFSVHFRARRRFDDALKEAKLAQDLDPLSPIIGTNVALVYLVNNDVDAAVREFKKVIDLDPNFASSHAHLGSAYLKQQRHEEAIAEFEKSVELSGRASLHLSGLGYVYAVTGKREEALQIVKELEERYAKGESIGQYPARVYAGLGDKDHTFAWLEKDFRQRSGLLHFVSWWFAFDDLRSDPRYADLMRRMNLPQ